MKNTTTTLALIFVVLAVVLYSMAFSPMSDSLNKARAELIQEKSRHTDIESGIRQRQEMETNIVALTSEFAACKETLIKPMLNSYSMQAKAYLDTMAHEAGLLNVEYSEGELLAMPIPKEQEPVAKTARRSVKILALGDYAAVASFILRAEKELPLMTLQSLTIKPMEKGKSVENQSVEMVVEWPCEGGVAK